MVSTTKTERTTERDRFIWLFNNCQDRVGISASLDSTVESKHALFEDAVQNNDTRPLAPEDVKVTVKWSTKTGNNELAHLTQIDSQPHYKLGIRFERWRRISPEQQLVTLGHELGHARYPNHQHPFWSFVIDIWQAMLSHKPTLESWFDTTINWDYVRSCMVDDVYNNTKPGNRTDMMQWASARLDYPAEWTQTLDWGQDLRETTTHWPHDQDDIRHISGSRIELSRSYSDEELVEFHNDLDATYDIYQIPVVTGTLTKHGTVTITQNEIVAALCLRTKYDPYVPVILKQD